jgi:hypothetical protein
MEWGSFWSWAHGIFFGLFFGLVMSVYNIGRTPSESMRGIVFGTVGSSVFLCFAFGLWESFGWRAFHSPIVFVTIPSGALGILVLWSTRSQRTLTKKGAMD